MEFNTTNSTTSAPLEVKLQINMKKEPQLNYNLKVDLNHVEKMNEENSNNKETLSAILYGVISLMILLLLVCIFFYLYSMVS